MDICLKNEDYLVYHGVLREILPKIFEDGLEPMSIADIVQRRLDVRTKSELKQFHDFWWNLDCYTSDLLLRDRNAGKGKIVVCNSNTLDLLRNIKGEDFILVDGAHPVYLPTTRQYIEESNGLELSANELNNLLFSCHYNSTNVKRSKVWKYLLGGQERLDAYVEAVVMENDRIKDDLMKLCFTQTDKFPLVKLLRICDQKYNFNIGSTSFFTFNETL